MSEAEYVHVHGQVHLALAIGFGILAHHVWDDGVFSKFLGVAIGSVATFDLLTAIAIYMNSWTPQ